jgi:flavin-dependent dehydrogenase
MRVVILGAGLVGPICAKVLSQRSSEFAVRRLDDGNRVRMEENHSIPSGENVAREVLG